MIRSNGNFLPQRVISSVRDAFLGRFRPASQARLALVIPGAAFAAYLLWQEPPWVVLGEAPEGKQRLRHIVAAYSWIAALINLAATAVLAATAGWWTRPLPRSPSLSRRKSPPWFWPSVGIAMTLSALLGLPRLNFSFWDDEDYNMRYSIFGRFKDNSAENEFRRAGWMDTFFEYGEPNNHVLHSILARTSLALWRAATPGDGRPFSEAAVRLPAFIFGVLAIGSVAWFLSVFGFPAAGAVAAILMALHPWHLRYATEARGYSLVLFVLPLALVFWRRALMTGQWRWWAAYALAQWALLYTYPGVLPVLVILNVAAIGTIIFSRQAAGPISTQIGRWFVANTCSAMAVIQLMLPLYPQAAKYLEYESTRNFTLGWSWIQTTLSSIVAGAGWKGDDYYPALANSASPWLLAMTMAALAACTLAGAINFLRGGWLTAPIVIAVLVPPLLTFGFSSHRGHLIYPVYVIYALPGLIAFAAVGMTLLWRIRNHPAVRVSGFAFVFALVAAYAIATQPIRHWLRTNPLQPLRDSVEISSGADYWARPANALSASFCIPPYLYDPQVRRLSSAGELITLMQRADREQRPLVLNIGMPWAAKAYSPQMWDIFNHGDLFENRRHLRGFDPGLDRIVAVYKPGSAGKFDFSKYDRNAR